MNGEDLILFAQWWEPPPFSLVKTILVGLGWLVVWLLPLSILAYATYFFLTIPLRRKERATLFLDLLETGFQQRQQPENFLPSISRTREPSVGTRFHLLAAHLERGLPLAEALKAVPRLLPPQISAMLRVGQEIGDIPKVLPACRMVLQDAKSQVASAINYVILVVFVMAPLTLWLYGVLDMFVFPKFKEIFHGLGFDLSQSPAHFIFDTGHYLAISQMILILLLYFLAALYVGGPRVSGWFREVLGPAVDWLHYCVPWRRKRMQRDFAQMLALLLESGVPEAKAVALAGKGTANRIFISQSNRMVSELERGEKLQNSLVRVCGSNELKWRFENARHGGNFVQSLSGWFEHLDAKAFQQEQAAAHIVSTAFVISNGVLVGVIVAGVFQLLVSLLNKAVLW